MCLCGLCVCVSDAARAACQYVPDIACVCLPPQVVLRHFSLREAHVRRVASEWKTDKDLCSLSGNATLRKSTVDVVRDMTLIVFI